MILISHRGNTHGSIKDRENKPSYITEALEKGFECEIDVWYTGNSFFLGHDEPQYKIDKLFLTSDKLWCHAKNITALKEMLKMNVKCCFWHQEDDCTLTSNGYIWTYPGKKLTTQSICVLPDSFKNLEKCAGICSDFIGEL